MSSFRVVVDLRYPNEYERSCLWIGARLEFIRPRSRERVGNAWFAFAFGLLVAGNLINGAAGIQHHDHALADSLSQDEVLKK